jgi:hypothetical protein
MGLQFHLLLKDVGAHFFQSCSTGCYAAYASSFEKNLCSFILCVKKILGLDSNCHGAPITLTDVTRVPRRTPARGEHKQPLFFN